MIENNIHTFAVLAYNESPYLNDCINSLKRQTFKSNIFIFTSTPNDYILKISEKHNIKIFINGNKKNIASDWTFAYQNVESKYVTLAHQDDIYLPNYTYELIKIAEKLNNNLILFSDYYEIFNNKIRKHHINLLIKRFILNLFFLLKNNIQFKFLKNWLLLFGSPICCPSVMYNKSSVGNFVFNENYKVGLDWDAWLQLAKRNGRFIYKSTPLILHRIHENSETSIAIKNSIRTIEDKEIFTSIWGKFIGAIINAIYSISTKS